MEVGISLGSNSGNRLAFLKSARDSLNALPNTFLVAQSSVYESSPVNVKKEYEKMIYFNAFVILNSSIKVNEWWKNIENIEKNLGRIRSKIKNSPRTIDIDLIYIDDICVDLIDLILPHPRWFSRRFVVKPFSDIRPNLVLPGNPFKIKDILNQINSNEEISLVFKDW